MSATLNTFGLFVLGWISWWATEYLLHRFVGHSRSSKLSFSLHHKKHHAIGDYFAPLTEKLKLSVIVVVSVYFLLGVLVGWRPGFCLLSGFLLSYLSYEWLHRRAHSHPPKTQYGRWLRRHHFHHHFMNPSANHGVTTEIGDLLFRTKDVPRQIRVPEKLKMVWLTDPQTDEVWPEFAQDYIMIHSRKRAPDRDRPSSNRHPSNTQDRLFGSAA
jgi:hypothetical protein